MSHRLQVGRGPGDLPGALRLVSSVAVKVDLDPFLDLRALSGYCHLSRRTLQALVNDPQDPLPSYRVGGKILVRRSEFDAWFDRRQSRKREAAACLGAADARGLQAVREDRESHLMEAVRRRDKRRIVARNQREALFDTLGRRCGGCGGTSDLTFDHITPWSHGGKTEQGNLQILCRRCNSRRGNRVGVTPPGEDAIWYTSPALAPAGGGRVGGPGCS